MVFSGEFDDENSENCCLFFRRGVGYDPLTNWMNYLPIIIFFAVVVLATFGATRIARLVYATLIRYGEVLAMIGGVATFVICFLILAVVPTLFLGLSFGR